MNAAREFSIEVVRQLQSAGYTAYWAGGCVRDLLRGVAAQDYDVATNATPAEVRKQFGSRRTLSVGESFGVMIVLAKRPCREQVEVATFRNDATYSDGRRPDAVAFSTPEEDAQRRDFTINGMFFDPVAETLHDFVGGQDDLRQRLVRAIGNASQRIAEDKLRMLRAVRFTAILGFFIEEETARAIRQAASEISVISVERIAAELQKMLGHPRRAQAMELCRELGLLPVLLPEVQQRTVAASAADWALRLKLLETLHSTSFEVAMAALLRDVPSLPKDLGSRSAETHGTVRAICRRLKFPNVSTDQICWLSRYRAGLDDVQSWSLARLKRLLVARGIHDLLHLERTAAICEGRSTEPMDWIVDYLARTPAAQINPPELITGQDLIGKGLKPGPRFKDLLRAIRDAQLNEQIATPEEALGLLNEFIQQEDDRDAV